MRRDRPACRPEPDGSCSICGDEGLVGEVVVVGPGPTARVRIEEDSARVTEVATDLLERVRPGDRLVVHLGFAIARVREAPPTRKAPRAPEGSGAAARVRGGTR